MLSFKTLPVVTFYNPEAKSAHILTLLDIKCHLLLLVEQLGNIWILLSLLGWTSYKLDI